MDINLSSKLKIKSMRVILILSLTFFIILLIFNYILTPIDLNVVSYQYQSGNSDTLLIKVIPKNELGFHVPFFLFKLKAIIIEGNSIVELKKTNNYSFLLIKRDSNSSGKVLIKFEMRDRKIQKFLELYLPPQKV